MGAPILREADGLAMSSRNAYLKPRERAIAGKMNLILRDVVARVHKGDGKIVAEQYGTNELLKAGFDSVDYVAIRDAESLQPVDNHRTSGTHPRRRKNRRDQVDRQHGGVNLGCHSRPSDTTVSRGEGNPGGKIRPGSTTWVPFPCIA